MIGKPTVAIPRSVGPLPDDWFMRKSPDRPRNTTRPGAAAVETIVALDAALDGVRTAEKAIPRRRRWWKAREFDRAIADLREAQWRFQDAYGEIARSGVGSVPGEWGLLSDNTESTIDFFLDEHCDVGGDLRERLSEIQDRLLEARLASHSGDRALERQLTLQLAQCLDLEPDDEYARLLLHHLPGWARPIPHVDVGALARARAKLGDASFAPRYFSFMNQRRCNPSKVRYTHRTFTVSLAAADMLDLHDIIVVETGTDFEPVCSPGLGTAAVQHLCRTADRYGLAIKLWIMPGDRTEGSAARLAGWYRRHGFEIQQRSSPGTWCMTSSCDSSR